MVGGGNFRVSRMQTLSATDIHNAPWIEPEQMPKEAIFKRFINYALFQYLSCATSAFVVKCIVT